MEANAARIPRPPIGIKLILGLYFAGLGIVLTADNLDLLDADDYLAWWPVVLIAAGLVKLRDTRGLALILLAVGASLLAYNLGWLSFTVFDLWPLLLIGGGLVLVARSLGFAATRPQALQRSDTSTTTAIFATRRATPASRNFSRSSVFAFIGGVELDLTEADITEGPAIIDATAVWAGIEILVPENWNVVGEVTPLMGGFEMQTGSSVDPNRTLIVRGVALMGGIEVKTRPRRTP